MQVRWNLYCFDHARYLGLRPLLRAATTPDAFAALGQGPEVDAIVEAVAEESLLLEGARNALVQTLCCVGDPLPVDASFPRFVAALARRHGAEDAAEALGALVSGGKSVEPWLTAADGLVGMLTPDETQRLYHSYAPLTMRRGRSMARVGRASARRVRRGGLVGACVRFVRHLFHSGPQPDDLLILLGQLLREAQAQEQGVAIVVA